MSCYGTKLTFESSPNKTMERYKLDDLFKLANGQLQSLFAYFTAGFMEANCTVHPTGVNTVISQVIWQLPALFAFTKLFIGDMSIGTTQEHVRGASYP